jgi:hypothetical protein
MKRFLVLVLLLSISACQLNNTVKNNDFSGNETLPTQETLLEKPTSSPTSTMDTTSVENPKVESIPIITQSPSMTPTNPALSETPTIQTSNLTTTKINPLTGLPVDNSDLLKLPPALVSIANFPVSARPQAGLSFSPFVFEMYIGEGMTRFLALFYGEYPSTKASTLIQDNLTPLDNSQIGPIRSGRLPYESLRKLYSGFLVMASAYRAVSNQLSATTNIYGSDEDDINSALIDVSKLEAIAEANSSNSQSINLSGNMYSSVTPDGGSSARRFWVFYNFLNQVDWQYDETSGKYLRSQDIADGSGTFTPSSDRLTGEQLGFENVILLFAKHKVLNSEGTLIDLDLLYTGNKAFLFRDMKIYPLLWNTMNGEYEKSTGLLRPIRFTDLNGKPISIKPGHTWVEIVDVTTTLEEIDPGTWKARFYAP